MVQSARFHRRSLLLCSLLLLCYFPSSHLVRAQGGLSNAPELSTITQAPGATDTASSSAASQTGTTQNTASSSNSNSSPSSTTSSGGFAHLTSAPDIGAGIPPLIVPDTSDAPFMQKSNLPEGTVFICVGAVLGFLGAAVLVWRGLVAWLLHRSVKRAASRQYASETKSTSYRSGSRFRNPSIYDGSSMSLEHLARPRTTYHDGGASGDERSRSRRRSKHSRHRSRSQSRHGSHSRSRRTSRQAGSTRNSTLFFSPTAAGMQHAAQKHSSSHLPAGYYASGLSATAGGAGIASIGGPPAAGYMRMDNSNTPSPPLSPRYPSDSGFRSRDSQANPFADRPRGSGMMYYANSSRGSLSAPHSRNPSAMMSNRTSINVPPQHNEDYLSRQPQQVRRAPSAYLDDVLDLHGSAMGER